MICIHSDHLFSSGKVKSITRGNVSSSFSVGRSTSSSLIHFRRRQMARWNLSRKVEALERASCQRGLAGRRLPGWPLLQLYTTTPEDYPPVKEVVRASAARRRGLNRRIGDAVRRICDQSRLGSGNMARSVVLNRRVLVVTLSLSDGVAAGVEEGGRAPMTPYARLVPHQRVRVSVTRDAAVCARVPTCVRASTCKGRTQGERSPRAHAHREGVVHLNRGGWYTHAAGVG